MSSLTSWHVAGYVQGMSDLLSPILFVMKNEDEAFWCFVGLMEKLVRRYNYYLESEANSVTFFSSNKDYRII